MNGANSLRAFLHRLGVAFIVAVVLSSGVIVAANALTNQKLSSINRINLPDDVLSPGKPGAPANYLIIGSDSREFVNSAAEEKAFGNSQELGTGRSDVMMIVHVVPALDSAFVVSFPRDTYVDIPGHGRNLLNAAFALGGPALTIKTFAEDFGIPIQHYLSVDFVGFQKIVDAIGHVKIYFPTPARDFFTGLNQPEAGCLSLNGVEALEYARSRHYAIPKDSVDNPDPGVASDWNEDPRADLDRIQRQQYFLRSLGQTALEHGARNPFTALRLADAVASSLTGDKTLSNRELKSLVLVFRGLDPASVEMTTLPVESDASKRLVVQYPEAQTVINRLKNLTVPVRIPIAVPPAKVKVVVVDGSGVEHRASKVESALAERGFATGGHGDADHAYDKTQVRYGLGGASKGLTVALYLGTANVVEAADTTVQLGSKTLSGDVIVVIGRDYPKLQGLLSTPPTTTTVPPSVAPEVTTTTSAESTSTTSTSTTTTTAPVTLDTRYVPVSRKGRQPLVGCP